MGILSILVLPALLFLIPFGENLSRYQNPIRRPIMVSIFLSALIYVCLMYQKSESNCPGKRLHKTKKTDGEPKVKSWEVYFWEKSSQRLLGDPREC